jgi:hypothetical protein
MTRIIEEIEEYWTDFHKVPRISRMYPDFTSSHQVKPLVLWANSLGEPDHITLQVLPGDEQDRGFRTLIEELPSGVLFQTEALKEVTDLRKHLMTSIKFFQVPRNTSLNSWVDFIPPMPEDSNQGWDILWYLVALSDLAIPPQLKYLMNFNSRITKFYRALMEVRFETQEKRSSAEDLLTPLLCWIEGGVATPPSVSRKSGLHTDDQIELLLFILTLAKYNLRLSGFAFYMPGVESLSVDGYEQLNQLLNSVYRWMNHECPLSLLLGWIGSKEDQSKLRRKNSQLLTQLRQGTKWVKSVT